MISFEDTFCNFSDCAEFLMCPKGFTEKETERWAKDLPVCFYADRPDCYVLECREDGVVKPIRKGVNDNKICPTCRKIL